MNIIEDVFGLAWVRRGDICKVSKGYSRMGGVNL